MCVSMCRFHLQGLLTFTLLLSVFFTEVLWHILALKRTSSEAADLSRCWSRFCTGEEPCEPVPITNPSLSPPASKHASNVGDRRWSRFGTREKDGKVLLHARARARCPNIAVALLSCTFIHRSIFHFHWVMELKGQFSYSYSYLTEREL